MKQLRNKKKKRRNTTADNMEWRCAEPNDFEWIKKASMEHHKKSDWSEVKYSEEKCDKYIRAAINDPYYFGIIAEKDEERNGFMTGRLL